MLSPLLRGEMIVVAVLIVSVIIRNVNRKKLRIQYSLIWLLIAAGLLAVAFFPGIVVWLCGVTGIETPANLLYLFGILALLLIVFYQTILISRQADRITRLTQILSIEKYLSEQKEAPLHAKEPEAQDPADPA